MTLTEALSGSGSAVLITSMSYSGAAAASGTYSDGPLGIADGALLTTGSATNALPPNDSASTSTDNGLPGHSLCNALIPGYTSYDATLLTIEFDLAPAFDGISFNFVFGSEEYPEYVGSSYNDVFGVYLNGTQVAFDDTGNPITINGPFFSGGSVVTTPANGTEYDGTTGILTTQAPLAGGSIGNVLEIVICDAGDRVLDSGAFISGLNGCVGNDCSGTVPCSVIDNDGDGVNACDDCDDANPDTYPGGNEVCDFVDNDCDSEIDEGGVCTPVCVTIQRGTYGTAEDASIWENAPHYNSGSYTSLYTGYTASNGLKMSLVQFGVESAVPPGATVTEATLSVFQEWSTTSSEVRVHQVLEPWSEATVTWESFDGAYDPAVLGSFTTVSGVGSHAVDVTGIVGDWVSGAEENHGFLLEEDAVYQHTYRSSENLSVSQRPALEICYYGGAQ